MKLEAFWLGQGVSTWVKINAFTALYKEKWYSDEHQNNTGEYSPNTLYSGIHYNPL